MKPQSLSEESAYNIMMLIDKSGSMNGADPNRLALSAACQFIDQLRETDNIAGKNVNLSEAVKIGVMSFDFDTERVSDLISLDSEVNVDLLKSRINSIKYLRAGTGATDLNTAFFDAVRELEKHRSENRKNVILMFTDGYSTARAKQRQRFSENLKEAFQIAEELSCEVFIVGLNYNNSIMTEGVNEIQNISDTTRLYSQSQYPSGLKTNYLITDNFNSIRVFYGNIFAYLCRSEMEFVENHQFVIKNGVVEANVLVYSDAVIRSVSIEENGNLQIVDGISLAISEGDPYYKAIKILNPKVGLWTVSVTTDDDAYNTYVVKVYGVEIALSANYDGNDKSGYEGEVTVTPMYKGEPYADEGFISSVTKAVFTASAEDSTDVLGPYNLTYQADSGNYTTKFPITPGQYVIEATLENDSMFRTAICTLTVHATSDTSSSLFNDEGVNSLIEGRDNEHPTDKSDGWHWYPWLYIALLLAIIMLICFLLYRRFIFTVGGYRFIVHINLVDNETNSTYREEGEVGHYPRGSSFSLWKLVYIAILVGLENPFEGILSPDQSAIYNRLNKDRINISKYKLVLSNVRRKRKKIFKIQKPDGSVIGIDGQIDTVRCYRENGLEINLQLIEDKDDFSDEHDDDFMHLGNTSSRKRKTRAAPIDDDSFRL